MSKDFIGQNHGKNKIKLRPEVEILCVAGKPIEIHLQEDMCLDDKPGFAIVLAAPKINRFICGQISLAMLNEGLADIGYEIRKKE